LAGLVTTIIYFSRLFLARSCITSAFLKANCNLIGKHTTDLIISKDHQFNNRHIFPATRNTLKTIYKTEFTLLLNYFYVTSTLLQGYFQITSRLLLIYFLISTLSPPHFYQHAHRKVARRPRKIRRTRFYKLDKNR
jgi:hypothetical protein